MDMSQVEWWLFNVRNGRAAQGFDDDRLTNGEAWEQFLEELRLAGEQVLRTDVPATPLDRATGYRHLLGLTRLAIDEALATPLLQTPTMGGPSRTDIYKWGLDCPDAAYRGSPIDGASTYILRGRPGSMPYMSFQANAGMANVANLRKDELILESDGSFIVHISPDEHEGNWLRTTPDCDALIMREFFWDWDNDRSGTVEIEIVTPAGRLLTPETNEATPARVGAQLREIGTFIRANMTSWTDVEVSGQRDLRNGFPPATAKAELGGAQENLNAWGHFDLQPDEALIIECTPAQAQYWSVHLGNFWWESLDYATRHTSLNGYQCVLDGDGKLRVVVSPVDPGVPNWLDTCGHLVGPMLFRWVVCEEGPDVTCTVVKAADVRSHLPQDTATVTPAERSRTLARRAAHVHRRMKG
jgi:hypothetical protein